VHDATADQPIAYQPRGWQALNNAAKFKLVIVIVIVIVVVIVLYFDLASINGAICSQRTLDFNERAEHDGPVFGLDASRAADMNGPTADNPVANQPGGREALNYAAELKLVIVIIIVIIIIIIPVFSFNFPGVD
jgi:hypothetical protein